MTRNDTDVKTLADGTIQVRCQHEHCHQERWFTPETTGRPPRFCSANCRVAQHRLVKMRAEHEAARVAREAHLAQLTADHQRRYVEFLKAEGMTGPKAERLYAAMIEAKMIEGPFKQDSLFRN